MNPKVTIGDNLSRQTNNIMDNNKKNRTNIIMAMIEEYQKKAPKKPNVYFEPIEKINIEEDIQSRPISKTTEKYLKDKEEGMPTIFIPNISMRKI